MRNVKEDKLRENRISMEIIIDCRNEEQAMGWYYYLEGALQFPFTAKGIAKRAISPLREGDIVEVQGMAPEDECEHEMFVNIRREKGIVAVPLSQLEGKKVTGKTKEAIEDWRYWVNRGYEL